MQVGKKEGARQVGGQVGRQEGRQESRWEGTRCMQVGKKRVAKQVGRQVDSQIGRQVGRYMQVGKEVHRESLGQTVGRQVRRESLGRYVGRQVERGVPSCVRSTVQDYRTKTTRYTLFSLNWRKRSSAKLSSEIRSQLPLAPNL